MKKILFTICLLFSMAIPVASQIIPPSPESESFVRYVENPVNFKTGSCDVRIPLYEIISGDLRLPISLSYHSTGRKTYERNGPVGLEWLLDTGGMITRTVYGLRDDDVWNFPVPFPNDIAALSNKNNYNFLAGVNQTPLVTTFYDTQYDIFSYNFGGASGNFILKDENNQKIPEIIPNRSLKVFVHKVLTPHPMFDYIEVIDENGIFYRFGKSIKTGEANIETTGDYVSTWYISEIIAADKQDTISFKYNTVGKQRMTYNELVVARDQHSFYGSNAGSPTVAEINSQEQTNQIDYSSTRIREITFKNGKILFFQENNSDLISKMVIYSNNLPLKTVGFAKSLLDSPVGLYTFSIRDQVNYKLDKVTFQDANNVLINQYQFEYFPSTDFNVRHNDWWGYYNGSTANPYYLIPRYSIPFTTPNQPPGSREIGHTEADRNPNAQFAQYGILKRVIYPTGGKTDFYYESNKYKSYTQGGIIANCGGLRIYKTVNSDISGNVSVKSYRYGENENGYGLINYEPGIGLIGFEQSEIKYYSGGLGGWAGCYQYGFGDHEFIRTRYYSSDVLPQYSNYFYSPVRYPEISVYDGEISNNNGKTVFKYETIGQSFGVYSFNMESPVNSDLDYSINGKHEKVVDLWRNNELKEQVMYNKNNEKVSRKSYAYSSIPKTEITGMHLTRFYSYPESYDYEQCAASYSQPVYVFDSYSVSSGVKQLQAMTETVYFNSNDSIFIQTGYTYNTSQLISRIEKTTNFGKEIIRKYYPSDYSPVPITDSNTDQQIITEMQNNNMLSQEIEEQNLRIKDNVTTLIGGKIYRYKKQNGLIVPGETYDLDLSTPSTDLTNSFFDLSQTLIFHPGYKRKLVFDYYNSKGNLLQATGRDGLITSYLWDATGSYPLAQVKGSTFSQISTFEGLPANSSSSTLLLNLKSLAPNAFITTYSYKPLVGLSSQTDPNGKTTYYEYDDFGRLKFTKDDQGEILKKFDYHYRE